MEISTLILFFFLLAIVSATAYTVAEIGRVVRTLKARLDRQDAAETKQRQNPNSLNASLVGKVFRKNAEIEALEHTIALKDAEIKNLNGDIAKLKFDYACQVADCRCGKPDKGTEETFSCEKCGSLMTSDDQADYNQFTQIDFNCCKSCADSGGDED